MVSKEHQELINNLANALESKEGVTITHVAIQGTPEHFDDKFKQLPEPPEYDKRVPDLQGNSEGIIHLGEAELDPNDDNVEVQLKTFSSFVMEETKTPIPLHVIIPKNKKEDMRNKIKEIGLGDELDKTIFVWA